MVDIEGVLEEIGHYDLNEETQIFNETAAEFLVVYSGPPRPVWSRADLEIEDEVDGYKYRLGKPSLAFALAIADRIYSSDAEFARRHRAPSPMARQRFFDSEDAPLDLFVDNLRITSLRIESDEKTSHSTFQALADSFYFHVGYNLDYPVVPRPTLQESLRRHRIQYLRRGKADSLDAPHKRYIPDLVHNYQLALSTDSPMLSYISYYHVAEHWFEEVFQNDIAVKLQAVITSPGFSYRRMKDMRRLIKTVSEELKTRDDEVVINELSALKLTLMRYVNISELADSIDAFDSSLLKHYSDGAVAFSGGDAVNLRDTPDEKLYGRLARRIYKNRNALVHRKNGAKSRFAPFRDDHALDPEVPIMRFIAEQIIISSATV
ncbi:hypothetical protein NHL51_05225 [Leucobacter sp. gxy201]|uniref:hypothetical protein n=1 Tax=Leucobacter sp. gxy201 TaxID=2957200 RepID=UPI003DA03128